MNFRIKQPLLLIVIGIVLFTSVRSSQATTAYFLDTSRLTNIDELYLVGTLQGIVNRDAPRLFLSNVHVSNCNGAGNTYKEYLETHKGFTFIELRTLNEAVATFASLKRADGVTPLIKGMVKYGGAYYNNWIAANFAAQEDLIAVTDKVLNNQSQMLSGGEFWYKDTAMTGGWGDNFATTTTSINGRSVTPRAGRPAIVEAEVFSCYSARVVYVDLAVTPKIEVVVSNLSPGGIWSLGIAMGSTVNTYSARESTKVPALTHVTTSGTFTVDLAASGLFNPTSGRAVLSICPMTDATTVTVKSIRFLAANGLDPVTPLYAPPKNEFSTLTITRDLTVSKPYADNEASACIWSLANQRTNCDPSSFCSFGADWSVLQGLDYGIAQKSYIFYQGLQPFVGPYPNLDTVLSGLQQPSSVFGWIGDESYSCMKMAQYGSRYGGGPSENWSFWQWVPLDNPGVPILTEPSRQVTTLEDKNYVNFSWASSDATELGFSLMVGYWGDPNRGQIPITWGFHPGTSGMVPALVEYFGKTATPNDTFWNGVSGSGYTHPSSMPDSSLALYAEATRRDIAELGTSSALDYWDTTVNCPEYFDALTTSTSAYPPVKLIATLPDGTGAFKSYWLDNGTPVIGLDQAVYSKNEGGTAFTPAAFAALIQTAAAKHVESGPKFITCNVRISPTFALAVKNLLPANFKIVGMQDFVGLAQDAGALAVVPFSDSVGSGDSVKVSIELHNASGNTGGAGTVTWTMPAGWTASPSNWAHGTVAKGSNLKQIVTFTPPAGMTSGTAAITFRDSRFAWTKQVLLTTYADSRTVTDCQSTAGWSATGGASLVMNGGMVKVLPMTQLTRSEYFSGISVPNNGRVSYPLGWVDLSRNPVLKLNMSDGTSFNTGIGVSNGTGTYKSVATTVNPPFSSGDLRAATGWSGAQSLTLNLDPVTLWGKYVKVRSIKVCYPQAQQAPLVVSSGTAILSTNPYVTLKGGTLLADPAQGATTLNMLTMAGNGTLTTAANFTLVTSQLSGSGMLTIQGQGSWASGVSLQTGDNSAFTGKIVLNNTWLWATDSSVGAVPSIYTADALTLNGSTLVFTGTMPATRGITLGTGASQIYGSVATLNSKITGPGGVLVRNSTVLFNNVSDFAGTYSTRSSVTTMGVDNALPHGAGKGNVNFVDWDGGTTGSTIDLNGKTLTINGLTQTIVTAVSNVDNKATGPATLVLGDNNATASFAGIIKNTGGALSLTKIGTGTQTLTGTNTYSGTTTVSAGTLALSGTGSIANSSAITIASGAVLDATGRTDGTLALGTGQRLTVNGQVKGIIQSSGGLAPGSALLTLGSSYQQSASGSLEMTITGATTSGALAINGPATVSGTLRVSLGAYTPVLGNNYTILTATAITGFFSTLDLPPLDPGLIWTVTYGPTSVKITVSGQFWDISAGTAGAQGGTGIWDTSTANWHDGIGTDYTWPNNNANSVAVFGDAAVAGTATVTVSGTVGAGGLRFNSTTQSYVLTGGTVSMSSGTLAITTDGSPVTIASVVAGNGQLIKNGSGSLTLGAINTYTGGTLLNGGTLSVGGLNQLGSNPAITLNGGTLVYTGTAAVPFGPLTFTGAGTVSLPNSAGSTTSTVASLSGNGVATFTSNGAWATGISLTGANPAFTGKLALTNTWLWVTGETSFGATPATLTPNAITLNGSTLSVSGTLSANRGITLGSGTSQIYSSTLVLNNRITGTGALRSRYNTLTLNNNSNDFAGDYHTYSTTTIIGVDNALPRGAGKGNVNFLDWDGGTSGSTVDLNGHTLTINGLSQGAVSGGANVDNKATGAATLVLGDNNATASFGGVIKNTGGALSLTKIGTGKQTLTGINTYSGATTVNGGTLALTGTGALANTTSITVAAGAVCEVNNTTGAISDTASVYLNGTGQLSLAAGVNETVSKLYINGTQMASGIWNATRDSSHFKGSGNLIINQ